MEKIIKKPSFFKLVIGSLLYSIGLSKREVEVGLLKKIDDYKLIKKIKKENKFEDSFVGCYEKNGKKFFIKTYLADREYHRNYFTISEWLVSNVLYKALKFKNSKIATPKPIEIISSDEYISLVYEFIDGKILSEFSTSYQTKVFIQIINELKQISNSLTKDEIKFIPKRSMSFYLISLPYLSLLTFFRTNQNFKIVSKAFLATLKMLSSEKTSSRLSLAHRDLKPHNVMIKDSKTFLVDVGRMSLTLYGYDLALLSLDPAHLSLSKSLEQELKTSVSKFLKSYIAIQFADRNISVGVGIKYWEFIKSEYGNTNSKKRITI